MPEQLRSIYLNKDLKHISAPDCLPSRWFKDLLQVLSCEFFHLRSFAVSLKEIEDNIFMHEKK